MKNLVGGIVCAIVGSGAIALLVSSQQYSWPGLIPQMAAILKGAFLLAVYGNLGIELYAIQFIVAWCIVGALAAGFSDSKANSVRTLMWTGVVISILVIAGVMIQNPGFWQSSDRNIVLLLIFIRCIAISMFALVTAVPISHALEISRRVGEAEPPEKIETVCECGAVYKSNPMICAECGRTLRQASSLPGDSASE
jgi:hypothetical protein